MKKIIVKKEVISPKKANSDLEPTIKLSNVFNYLNGVLRYETAKAMNDGSSVQRPQDPNRLACMLPMTYEAEKKAREEAESKGLTYWIDRAEYIRRHLALKTRQYKETEKIAIELSNQLDVARERQKILKDEHKKTMLFANKRVNRFIKANENLNTEIKSLKRLVARLEHKNLSLDSVNVRMMSKHNKEVGELKKSLMDKDYEIEQLKLRQKDETISSQDPEAGAGKTGKRHRFFLDGYPIELDLSSDSSRTNSEREQTANDDSECEFVDVPSVCSEAPDDLVNQNTGI